MVPITGSWGDLLPQSRQEGTVGDEVARGEGETSRQCGPQEGNLSLGEETRGKPNSSETVGKKKITISFNSHELHPGLALCGEQGFTSPSFQIGRPPWERRGRARTRIQLSGLRKGLFRRPVHAMAPLYRPRASQNCPSSSSMHFLTLGPSSRLEEAWEQLPRP